MAMLRRAAREHDCLVGGGFIAVRGADTRGTYALVEPDGAAHLHDKDQPSFWENNYYSAGQRRRRRADVARADRPRQRLRVGPHAHGGADARPRATAGRRDALPVVPDLEGHEAVVLGPRPPGAAAVRARDAGADGADPRRPGGPSLARRRRRDVDAAAAGRRLADDLRRRDAHLRRRRRDARAPVLRGRRGLDRRRRRHRRRAARRATRCRPASGTRCCRSRCTRSGTSATSTAASSTRR